MTLSEEEYGLDSNKAIIIHTNDTLTTIRIRLKKTSHDKKKIVVSYMEYGHIIRRKDTTV